MEQCSRELAAVAEGGVVRPMSSFDTGRVEGVVRVELRVRRVVRKDGAVHRGHLVRPGLLAGDAVAQDRGRRHPFLEPRSGPVEGVAGARESALGEGSRVAVGRFAAWGEDILPGRDSPAAAEVPVRQEVVVAHAATLELRDVLRRVLAQAPQHRARVGEERLAARRRRRLAPEQQPLRRPRPVGPVAVELHVHRGGLRRRGRHLRRLHRPRGHAADVVAERHARSVQERREGRGRIDRCAADQQRPAPRQLRLQEPHERRGEVRTAPVVVNLRKAAPGAGERERHVGLVARGYRRPLAHRGPRSERRSSRELCENRRGARPIESCSDAPEN
mmetsp:Transcript_25699/g.74336  ORF Transcript_25699/g.74336 Transcript_25699/m.74336 type:complete len:332 (+) Transcript_25699:211-1206(+)